MSRIEWKDDVSRADQPVLRGYVGTIPSYTIRKRADGAMNLTDRLRMQFEVHEDEAGAKKAAENALKIFMERIGAVFAEPETVVAASKREPRKLADTHRQILQNVADGKRPLDGFEGSSLGGAVTALQFWREKYSLIGINGDEVVLTDAGRKLLETGEY